MERTMERNVENLLCGGAFSNPEHKESLHSRLFAQSSELSLDELDSVVGGKSSGKKKKKPESPTCPHCGPSVKLEKISGCEAKCKKCKKKFNLKAM